MITASRGMYIAASIVWMGVIFFLSSIPELRSSLPSWGDTIARKAAHVIEYAVLSFLLARSFDASRTAVSRARSGAAQRGVLTPRFVLVCIMSILYAASDEWHQSFVPGRQASFADGTIDTIGIVLGLCVARIQKPRR